MADDTDILAAALEYTRYGWSVIPIWPPGGGHDGKRPALSSWTAYTRRRPTPDELSEWFTNGPRNIAIVCGDISEGLVVIDCDDERTYHALTFLYPELRQSLTVTTGKGYHIYTYAPVMSTVRTASFTAFGHRHHIKASGSYVIAPPSVHQSGRRYQFTASVPPIELDLTRLHTAVAALDPTSAAALHELRQEHRAPANPDANWVANAIRDGADTGERDNLTFRLACYFLRHMPEDIVQAILELWAEHRCAQTPDRWGPAQVANKIRSARSYTGNGY